MATASAINLVTNGSTNQTYQTNVSLGGLFEKCFTHYPKTCLGLSVESLADGSFTVGLLSRGTIGTFWY